MLFLILLTSTLGIIWSFPFILCGLFRYRLYLIENKEKVNAMLKAIEGCWTSLASIDSGSVKPSGLFIGWLYIGFVYEKVNGSNSSRVIYVLCRHTFISAVTQDRKEKTDKIDALHRTGHFFCLSYVRSQIKLDIKIPSMRQTNIIETISDYYAAAGSHTVFIYGPTGSYKTSTALLLADKLNGTICYSFDPTSPGDNISALVCEANPTKEKPLIILIDEVDIMIADIHDGVTPHKHIPISVRDKRTFNTFMDRLKDNDNVILVLTSNKTLDEIDAIDRSYLRNGRVDLYFRM